MKNHRTAVALLSVVLFGVGITAATAQVVTGDYGTPPRLIPYTGYLENGGVPVNGTIDLSFFVADTVGAPSTSALWQEDHTGVFVSSGRFVVTLGQMTGFGTLLTDHGELYVGVSIGGNDLEGRQRLSSAPYAISVGEAQNFTVRGALGVNGLASLNGGVDVTGDATISGDFTEEVKAAAGLRVRKVGNTSRVSFDAQLNDPGEIVHYEDNNLGELWLSSSDDWDANSGQDRVIIGDFGSRTEAFAVQGDGRATVRGDLVVNGNSWAGNDWSDQITKNPSGGNNVSGAATPDGGWAVRTCPNGQYMCGVAFTHAAGENGTYQERLVIRCCSL